MLKIAGRKFAAFLFDMDGTILDSSRVASRIWSEWAVRQGLDVEAFMPTIAGVRAIETIARLALPGIDAAYEADEITRAEIADVEGIHAIDGALAFLAALPPHHWAIVTSSPRELARRRLEAVGIPVPAVIVTGEDVSRGKPAPDCFQLGAKRLGVDVRDCLVFEDAPAGIEAAEAAGAAVAVITASHRDRYETRHPTFADYTGLKAVADADGGIWLHSD
ncbi:HAD-IA family hydrolase [Mesorhizobium sp. A556]